MERYEYPFSALVGQEKLKTALLLNLVEPRLGGVLIQGEKGTAKSTAVRGLAELMDEVEVAEGCPFHCRMDGEALCDECRSSPARRAVPYRRRVVELPVSATEDRVVGTLDLERALKEGVRAFEPGLLAQANGNILYVDEINLLEDHIVDVLLDSAAMGVNTVEREGISYSHPARFILVGTMNPEEGDLRPQLLDRFGLMVEVHGEQEAEARKEVVRRRLAFEENPAAFCARTSPMPAAMASTACWRVMAGPVVKSAVPAAMRQFCTPGTGSPAMPRSTGTTSQRAVFAIWQTLVRRAARFSATARVTLWSVWLTPCATTPLSAQSTSTARRENASSAVPVRAAASSSMVSSLPSPPSGLARLTQ